MEHLKSVMAGFALGLVVAVTPACGPTKCTPSSCATGCCDSKGQCQDGRTNGACGQLGGTCTQCLLGQACNLGTCMNTSMIGGGGGSNGGGGGATGGGGGTTGGGGGAVTGGGGGATGGGGGAACGPSTCTGCCDASGVCVQPPNNNNNTTCGRAGAACTDCAASGATCNSTISQCTSGTGGGGGACDGCYFNGTCIIRANSNNDTLCGQGGVQCATCTNGAHCTNYVCSGATGGGTGGGGGAACAGCLLPPSGTTCVPPSISGSNVTNCGLGGVMCLACGAGQTCTNGVCTNVAPTGLGAPCTVDSDCSVPLTATDSQIGVTDYCKKNAIDFSQPSGTGIAFPGGFCTKRCGFETGSCGTTGTCLYALGFVGHYENMCFKSCAVASDCRPGYACLSLGTVNVCLPSADGGTPPMVDAGPGRSAAAGSACTTDTQCQPPSTGSCITAVGADGGATGFLGGQCTAECGAVAALSTGDAWCGASGVCNPYAYNVGDGLGPLVIWQCDQKCTTDAGVAIPNACRGGYVCDTAGYENCVPNCNNVAGFCGTRVCGTNGLCQ